MTPNQRRSLLIAPALLAVVVLGVFGFWFLYRRTKPTPTKVAQAAAATAPPAAANSGSVKATPAIYDVPLNFRVALDEARSLRDPNLHSREFGRILRWWVDHDPEAALAYIRQLPAKSSDYTQGLLIVLEAIGQHDLSRALSLARELAFTREQLAIYSSLFAQVAQRNVQTAVHHLGQVPAGAARENALRALVDIWVRTDLPGALAWAEAVTDPADRAVALEVAFHELAVKDPLQVIELAQKSVNGLALERTVFNALQKITATDPQGASGLVALLPAGEMQALAAVDVASAFAAQNASAALAWAKAFPNDAVRSLATKRVLEVWAAADLPAATRYVAALPAGPEQQDAAVSLSTVLATANPQNAIAWAQTLPDLNTRPAALASIANAWAQRDPAAATHWVAEQPPGVLAILAPQTLNAALSYWVLRDSTAAQEFVRSLPPATQPASAEFLAPLLSQNNPANALAWAQSLPSADARDRALTAGYARWLDNTPAAAQTWLQSAHLPAETKAHLRALSH